MFRVSKRGIGYYRLVSPVDDYYVSVKHGEKGYEDDEHIYEIANMLCEYLNGQTPVEYPDIDAPNPDTMLKGKAEPSYYVNDGLSPIGAFKQGLVSTMEYVGFCKCNVIKYITRFQSKGNPAQDLHKARDYIGYLLEIYEGE